MEGKALGSVRRRRVVRRMREAQQAAEEAPAADVGGVWWFAGRAVFGRSGCRSRDRQVAESLVRAMVVEEPSGLVERGRVSTLAKKDPDGSDHWRAGTQVNAETILGFRGR